MAQAPYAGVAATRSLARRAKQQRQSSLSEPHVHCWTWGRSLEVHTTPSVSKALDGLGLGELLDLAEGLLEELLLEGRLGELGGNVLGNSLDKSGLLLLALLLLVADPRVEDSLKLLLDGGLLREEEVLVLESVGLLRDGVELLGEGDNVLELGNRRDALLDGDGVLLAGTVEDRADLGDLLVGPSRVGGTDRRADGVEDDQEAGGEDSLLVGDLGTLSATTFLRFGGSPLPSLRLLAPCLCSRSKTTTTPLDTHVELRRDGGGGKTSAEDDARGLREERRRGDGVDDLGSLLIGSGLCRFHVSNRCLPCIAPSPSSAQVRLFCMDLAALWRGKYARH